MCDKFWHNHDVFTVWVILSLQNLSFKKLVYQDVMTNVRARFRYLILKVYTLTVVFYYPWNSYILVLFVSTGPRRSWRCRYSDGEARARLPWRCQVNKNKGNYRCELGVTHYHASCQRTYSLLKCTKCLVSKMTFFCHL